MEEPEYFGGGVAEWGDDTDGAGVRKTWPSGRSERKRFRLRRRGSLCRGWAEAAAGSGHLIPGRFYQTPPPPSKHAPASVAMSTSHSCNMQKSTFCCKASMRVYIAKWAFARGHLQDTFLSFPYKCRIGFFEYILYVYTSTSTHTYTIYFAFVRVYLIAHMYSILCTRSHAHMHILYLYICVCMLATKQ